MDKYANGLTLEEMVERDIELYSKLSMIPGIGIVFDGLVYLLDGSPETLIYMTPGLGYSAKGTKITVKALTNNTVKSGFNSPLKLNLQNFAKKEGSQVTESDIRRVLRDDELKTQQRSVSLPRVQEYVDMLRDGKVVPPIRVDGNIIVEGNHRYVAGKVFGKTPDIQQYLGGNKNLLRSWMDLEVSKKSW